MTDQPRLIIRLMNDVGADGMKGLVLCTEDGKPFGMQVSCAVSSEVDSLSTVTATFHIDGEAIRFED